MKMDIYVQNINKVIRRHEGKSVRPLMNHILDNFKYLLKSFFYTVKKSKRDIDYNILNKEEDSKIALEENSNI